ncbi:2-hydroxycarboxylate transporter family protein [[Clostridium] aminophilum]|uniref:2-hydroxycarboxylate transporter family protein n=1 Tax=[Clostridium] aminophilum TaxID=1526 RepID=UPI0026F36FA1|nr:2-hydroxycarboxylate transporter family protein [[Clostridium] aminophilum]MDD6196673.1 2-hydroxycarboxylate transporter family protein [[Clostridium] aminophilum]
MEKRPAEIAGFPVRLYLIILGLTVVAMYTDALPAGMVGGMIALMVFGEAFNYIGNHAPVVRTYLGGSVICILGAAVVRACGLIPDSSLAIMDEFVNRQGFLVFYIAALITGSLFNIDRGLLLRATVKILPTAVTAIAAGMAAVCILGLFLGNSFLESLLYIGIPMTSGGMTAGAVPLSGMYAQATGADAGQILTRIAPATVLGNVIAIIYGALADRLGKKRPELTGGGNLVNDGKPVPERPPMKPTFQNLLTGLFIALAFYQLGAVLHRFVTIIPTYAWMIILVVLVKGTGLLSEKIEDAAREWGQFAIKAWTAAALTGIGFTLIDLRTILSTITPLYLVIIILVETVITLTAAVVGKMVGFYPIESAIAAGMCTTNMGGSGNVAVLSSSGRMELLPFAQIVTRSCGALMLTIGGVLIQMMP